MSVTADPALVGPLHSHEPTRFVVRLSLFLSLFAVSASAAVAINHAAPGWGLLLALPCYLLAAASLHGISLFTHEAVHGVLSPNKTLNHVLGAVCAWPVLQNFAAYRVLHLRHHAHLGVDGDPDHYENYTGRRWLVYAMHWGRLLLGYPAYIVAIPALGVRQGTGRDRLFIVAELAAVGVGAWAALSWVPASWLLHGWLVPMVAINTLVNIRGMSQHTLLADAADVIQGTRTILGNGISRFFMCNENYHLEHHLYPGVPWYHLPALHALLHDELTERRAPFIAGYLSFVRDFVLATTRGGVRGTVSLR